MTCTHVHDCHCPPPKLHLVVAGRHQHAQFVAQSFGWKPREWRYVVEAEYLRGYEARNTDIYIYASTYREHKNVDHIMREIHRMGVDRAFDVHWVEESELWMNRKPAPECKAPFSVNVPDSGNEVANLRRASKYIDDQLAYLGHRPAHDPFGSPTFNTVELREAVIPAHQVSGFRLAERVPNTVHIVSVEPVNPNERNGNWLVRFTERRP